MAVIGDESAVARFATVTDDSGRIDELTRAMYGSRIRIERHDGRVPSLGLAQAATATFGVQRITWDVDGYCRTAPIERFLCVRMRRGAYGMDQGRAELHYVAGETFRIDPEAEVDGEVLGADMESVSVELPVLESVAAQVSP